MTAQAAVAPSKPVTAPTASVEASWHTPLEWFVRCGGYRGRNGGMSREEAFVTLKEAVEHVRKQL